MSTVIRPEVSKKNQYWIDRHRYYELKHFCLQYPIWKKQRASLDGFVKPNYGDVIFSNEPGDPTATCAEAKAYYTDRIELVERITIEVDSGLASYILIGITEGVSYDQLKARLNVPCCKDVYYDLYRKFFWLLDRARK